MQVNALQRIDDAIAAVLGVFRSVPPGGEGQAAAAGSVLAMERDRCRIFERILLLHLAVRMGTMAYPDPVPGSLEAWGLGLAATAALALGFWPPARRAALALAFVLLCGLLWTTFPQTSNHGFLELWCVLLLLASGVGTSGAGAGAPGEAEALALQAIRASLAIVLFYTGVQKVLHGTYFGGDFLAIEVAMKPEFAKVFGWLASPEEIARIEALDPSVVGAGPFRTDAPLFLLASNLVYAFELVAPLLLVWPRTRRWAVLAVLAFTASIQSGAREFFFGALLVNGMLLYWPRNLHARVWPVFALFYVGLLFQRVFAPDALVAR